MKSIESMILTEACTKLVDHYHGLVIDHMKCFPQHEQLFSSLCGDHLFYHIVDDAQTGSQIIHHLNEANMPGEFHFMAANLVARDHEFDKTVMDCLSYSTNFENIFEYIISVGIDKMENDSLAEIVMKNTIQFYQNYRKLLIDSSSCDLERYMLEERMQTVKDDIKIIDNEVKAYSKEAIEKSERQIQLKSLQTDEQCNRTKKQKWIKQKINYQNELNALVIEKAGCEKILHGLFLTQSEQQAIDNTLKNLAEERIISNEKSKQFADISNKLTIATNFFTNKLLKTRNENVSKLLELEKKMKTLEKNESNIDKLNGTLSEIKMNLIKLQQNFDHKTIELNKLKEDIKTLTDKLQEINSKMIGLNNAKSKLTFERKKFRNGIENLLKRFKTTSIDSEEIIYTEDEVSFCFTLLLYFILFHHKINDSIFSYSFSVIVKNFTIRNQ